MAYDAWIFTLGNEVVEGRVVNTNASYLGRRLTLLGYTVKGIVSLPDDVALITEFLKYVISMRPKVIITTGGLGPTYDDRTLEAVSLATGRKLVLNNEAFRMIESKYATKGLKMTEDRIKMARLPDGSIPIPNPIGTAPGSWLEINDIVIVSLPGVPRELEAMFEGFVEKKLMKIGPSVFLAEKIFRVTGIPESTAAETLKSIVKEFPDVYVKSHPKGHEVEAPVLDIYIMASDVDEDKASEKVNVVLNRLVERLKKLGGEISLFPGSGEEE
jgi:molybdenum cofactor synthesis domain-containing protein